MMKRWLPPLAALGLCACGPSTPQAPVACQLLSPAEVAEGLGVVGMTRSTASPELCQWEAGGRAAASLSLFPWPSARSTYVHLCGQATSRPVEDLGDEACATTVDGGRTYTAVTVFVAEGPVTVGLSLSRGGESLPLEAYRSLARVVIARL